MFVAAFREAQRQRVARLDRFARATLAGSTQARSISRSFPADQPNDAGRLCMERRGATRRYMLIYRTIADPAMLDLTIEPDDRPSGGFDSHPRPDIQNYAQGGFAHYMTPRAWLSTWSGLSSNAASVQRLKEVTVPALFVHYAADIFTRLSELGEMEAACGATDKTVTIIRHTDHYGRRVAPDGSLGERVLDGTRAVRDWMQERFPA
jgi:pimeloyl-ACP methyl ester carboxylesterase